MTFKELYNSLLTDKDIRQYNPKHLDCLTNPEKYAPVIALDKCGCEDGDKAECVSRCVFNAISFNEDGTISIDKDKCAGCALCIDLCKSKNIIASKDVIPVMNAIKAGKEVYAMIAPAFISQYSKGINAGKLRTAFKQAGFKGMVEVALYADILSLKESIEFNERVNDEKDFMLTSCCCPVWIAMIRKVYSDLSHHLPASVSPMVACGRMIKKIKPDAITVFVGPCLAKKAEAREADIADSTDYVLTFQEMNELFSFFKIAPEECEEDEREHSSKAGRIYARAGGVSEAVEATLNVLNPDKKIKTIHADGIPGCKKLLESLVSGNIDANFIEGMGCVGGCVGGPKALIDRETGRQNVNEYGDKSPYATPLDNPFVHEMINVLGYENVEDMLSDDIFVRKF